MNQNNTAPAAGGEAAPAQNQPQPTEQNQAQERPQQSQVPTRAPRSDAEAAAFEAQAKQQAAQQQNQPNAPDAAKDGSDGKKPNRTTQYIQEINEDRARLRRELEELRRGSGQQQPAPTQRQPQHQQQTGTQDAGEPAEKTLVDFDFDLDAYTAYKIEQGVSKALKARDSAHEQSQSKEALTKDYGTYLTRIHEFSESHPDFQEVVDSMKVPLPEATQLAIMRHENGPAIAYHIATDEDSAYELALSPPHLVDIAIKRIAARLGAAPAASQSANPATANATGVDGGQDAAGQQPSAPADTNTPAAPAAKPLSNAPAPMQTLGGRASTDTPPEKLTDDQWYARERDRRRKR